MKKENNLFRQLLYLLLMLILVLGFYVISTETDLLDEPDDEAATQPAPATLSAPGEEPTEVAAAADWYQVYFTEPINTDDEAQHYGANLEQALIELINNAQTSIDAALFELDAPDTTAAMVRAIERGVQVRLVVDNEHALEDPGSTLQELIDAGAAVRDDDRSALMHNKYFIVDNTYVWTGATNVTRNGIYNQNNNAILLRSPEIVANFEADFEEMFVDGAFTVSAAGQRDVPYRTITIDGTVIETYFSPDDRDLMQTRLAELLAGADTTIRVMPFVFTLPDLGGVILERLNAGVDVYGVFDSLQGTTQYSQLPILACAGAEMRIDGNPDIMHHKVLIIDDEIVVTGSFNFSASALENNSENMLILHNPDIAAAYIQEFEEVFALGTLPAPDKLNCE